MVSGSDLKSRLYRPNFPSTEAKSTWKVEVDYIVMLCQLCLQMQTNYSEGLFVILPYVVSKRAASSAKAIILGHVGQCNVTKTQRRSKLSERLRCLKQAKLWS